jgi:hypothetical protein
MANQDRVREMRPVTLFPPGTTNTDPGVKDFRPHVQRHEAGIGSEQPQPDLVPDPDGVPAPNDPEPDPGIAAPQVDKPDSPTDDPEQDTGRGKTKKPTDD